MTDFIHEHHEEKPEPPEEQKKTPEPMDEQTGQKRVYGYIFLLFIVAFSLLLWSFLMNQRSTDEVLSELRGSASSLQSTLDRNITLEQRIDEIEQNNRDLSEQLSALRLESEQLREEVRRGAEQLTKNSLSLTALEYLRGLENAVQTGDMETAAACLERLEEPVRPYGEEPIEQPLKDFLPTDSTRKNPDGSAVESAAEAFARLRIEVAD